MCFYLRSFMWNYLEEKDRRDLEAKIKGVNISHTHTRVGNMPLPTPVCEGWIVSELLVHLLGCNRFLLVRPVSDSPINSSFLLPSPLIPLWIQSTSRLFNPEWCTAKLNRFIFRVTLFSIHHSFLNSWTCSLRAQGTSVQTKTE